MIKIPVSIKRALAIANGKIATCTGSRVCKVCNAPINGRIFDLKIAAAGKGSVEIARWIALKFDRPIAYIDVSAQNWLWSYCSQKRSRSDIDIVVDVVTTWRIKILKIKVLNVELRMTRLSVKFNGLDDEVLKLLKYNYPMS